MPSTRHLLTLAGLTAALFVSPVAAEDEVTITTTDLGHGIYMLVGQGGNIGLSTGDDATFLIDDQFAPLTAKITAAIAAVTARPVDFLVNTHYHGDHSGGNENFGAAGALIIAHDNVRARMSRATVGAISGRTSEARDPAALPVMTFSKTTTFHMNGEEIHVFHVRNAHTDGDSMVYFRGANILHTGDSFFNGFYPFIDVDTGASLAGAKAAIDRALALIDDDTKIIPGHGPLANRADMIAYRTMLDGLADAVDAGIESGDSLEDILAKKPFAALEADWGGGWMTADRLYGLLYKAAVHDRATAE